MILLPNAKFQLSIIHHRLSFVTRKVRVVGARKYNYGNIKKNRQLQDINFYRFIRCFPMYLNTSQNNHSL